MNLVCIRHEATSSLVMKRTMKSQSYRKPFKNLSQSDDENVVCSHHCEENRHAQSVDNPYEWGMIFPFLFLFLYIVVAYRSFLLLARTIKFYKQNSVSTF